MLKKLHPYRRLLLGAFLLAYAWSTFQSPILEVFHLLAHAQQSISGNHHVHSYASHEDHHHHEILDHLETLGEESPTEEAPTPEHKGKKKVEISSSDTPVLFGNTRIRTANYIYHSLKSAPAEKPQAPPPRFS